MAERIIMPKTGMSMETGTIIRWLKREGDPVRKGEPLLEIETDKVSMEVEAEADGVLLRIVRQAGEVVPVIETIGWIGAAGETVPGGAGGAVSGGSVAERSTPAPAAALPTSGEPADASSRRPATPAARREAERLGIDPARITGSGPYGAVRLRDVVAAAGVAEEMSFTAPVPPGTPVPLVTPLAWSVAARRNVDLTRVAGTGTGGRIRRRDIDGASSAGPGGASFTAEPPVPAASAPAALSRLPMGGMRRAIAGKMLNSHQQVPAVTLYTEADVTELKQLRARLAGLGADGADRLPAGGRGEGGAPVSASPERVSLTDFILRAVAAALRTHPLLNSRVEGEEIVLQPRVHVGLAVALAADPATADRGPDPAGQVAGGLIVPVLHDADTLSVRAIARRRRQLVEKARAGRLKPDEYSGGTFSVTNLGMYGIRMFTPLINVPESAILGVGSVEEALHLTEGGAVEVRWRLGLCLTHDHRHIDGAPAALFLQDIRRRLEAPLGLLVTSPGF